MKSLDQQLDQFSSVRLSTQAEEALAARIAQGDAGAVTELVMANMREALLYTGRCCGGEIDVATRISLCYHKLCMTAQRFRPGRCRFFAFAKAGLRGCMKDHWATLKLVRNVPGEAMCNIDLLGQLGHAAQRSSDGDTSGDDQEASVREAATGEVVGDQLGLLVDRDHLRSIRQRCGRLLSKQQWMVLDLIYVSGLNCPEAGRLLGVSRAAVHAAHQRALEKLRCGLRTDDRLLSCENTCT